MVAEMKLPEGSGKTYTERNQYIFLKYGIKGIRYENREGNIESVLPRRMLPRRMLPRLYNGYISWIESRAFEGCSTMGAYSLSEEEEQREKRVNLGVMWINNKFSELRPNAKDIGIGDEVIDKEGVLWKVISIQPSAIVNGSQWVAYCTVKRAVHERGTLEFDRRLLSELTRRTPTDSISLFLRQYRDLWYLSHKPFGTALSMLNLGSAYLILADMVQDDGNDDLGNGIRDLGKGLISRHVWELEFPAE